MVCLKIIISTNTIYIACSLSLCRGITLEMLVLSLSAESWRECRENLTHISYLFVCVNLAFFTRTIWLVFPKRKFCKQLFCCVSVFVSLLGCESWKLGAITLTLNCCLVAGVELNVEMELYTCLFKLRKVCFRAGAKRDKVLLTLA